jgi:hypothetical protein
VEYPIVVLLDVDTLILKPLEHLFDFLLDTRQLPDPDDLMYVDKPAAVGRNTNVTIPSHLDMLFTMDFAMVDADRDIKPFQGGFNMFRSNVTVLTDIMEIVRQGDYRFDSNGWGGHTGPMFWGFMYPRVFDGSVFFFVDISSVDSIAEMTHHVFGISLLPPCRFYLSRLDAILFSSIISRSDPGTELLRLE